MEEQKSPATAEMSGKKRIRQYKAEARKRAAAYRKELRAKKGGKEKKPVRKAAKAEIKTWKKSLKSVDKGEKRAQKKAYKAFKRRKNRTRRCIVWAVVLCLLVFIGYSVAPIVSGIGGIMSLSYTQGTPEADKARQDGAAVAAQISDEGLVLLKNSNGFLPLANPKVNVFGVDAYNFKYGGSGSGGADQSAAKTFFEGLTEAGIAYNEDLHQMYLSKNVAKSKDTGLLASVKAFLVGADAGDTADVDYLTPDVLENAKAYSDQAVIVLTNEAVEAADAAVEALKITPGRAALIQKVAENFAHVVVIVNAGNAMELGILDTYDNIEAALWVGTPGPFGCVSIGRALAGEVNPSGRLPDTYAYDITSAPASVNFGDYKYDNLKMAFINYNEGIYIGYRYYETRFAGDEAGYAAAVQYPFGFGLSYTDFTWETVSFTADAETVSWEVNVTNSGSLAGKDVVQLYFSAPYTEGGIEKSAIELAAYDKTKLLAPGESETLVLTYAVRDMSSYDMQTEQAYVLDAGEYQIKLARSVHEIVETQFVNIPETVVYDTDEVTGTELENRFGYADGGLTYLSRSDWEGTYPDNTNLSYTASDELLKAVAEEPAATDAAMPTTGADNGLMLKDLQGLDYDDPKWALFLDQFTVDEMKQIFLEGAYHSIAVERLGVPATKMLDGPAGINSMFSPLSAASYPTEVVVASTWNDDLAYALGQAAATEANAYGIQVWYAPAMNLHRTPQGGRNFEYYSEDPVLSGKMAAATTRGAQDQGVVVTIKHFAMNHEETNARSGIYCWSNEQAMRELYLRPFEIAVKEGGAAGAMSSFTHIGHKWSGGNPELLQDILRNEWGFAGMVTSDAVLGGFMDPGLAARYGNDLMLEMGIASSARTFNKLYKADPVGLTIGLRERVHNLCYVIVNETNLF